MSDSNPTTEAPEASAPEVARTYDLEGNRGHFDGEWLTEEDSGATRVGYRVVRELHRERSPFQEIAVYETRFFGKILTIDDLVMLTERDEFVYHEMLTHIPLCSLPDPKRVLVIGGGDCGIVREVLRHPVEQVVQCEIDERVTAVCAEHFPWVTAVEADPRCELVFDDGVRFMDAHQGQFDLVIIDSTDPVGPAVGLFQRAFYGKVAQALRPGGVMVAQTESPHWAASVVGGIYEELRHGFEHVHAYMGFIPTYPSGSWCWAYASSDRRPTDFFDLERAAKISEGCRYYNPSIQTAAFALPTFAERAVRGDNPFREFDERNREPLDRG